MAHVNEEKTFDDYEIRNTSVHNGTAVPMYQFQLKTIIVENTLDQTVTLQCQASAHSDFSHPLNVGSSFDVSSGTDSYQTCDAYFPYMRLTAQCSSSPTTGNINVHLIQYGE